MLGGTGRSGRTVAGQLARRGLTAVLVGRDANRLHTAAQPTSGETLPATSLAAAATQIWQQHPAELCADPPVRREVVLGVDTHGEVHVAAVVSPLGKVLDTEFFPAVGYRRLLVWARPAIRGCVAPPAVEGPL
ncbi:MULTISPECIES: hypothetical protein [unclassified Streptomyces]|uniref:hypothetical protein n=1 Tax=unclassified Streptomyces TaxID=2593676 RepID=UPI0038159D06